MVRIGDTIFNPDMITFAQRITLGGKPATSIVFGFSETAEHEASLCPVSMTFVGKKGEVLWAYLCNRAQDLTPKPQE